MKTNFATGNAGFITGHVSPEQKACMSKIIKNLFKKIQKLVKNNSDSL